MKSKRAQKELEKLEKFYPFSGWIAPSDTYRIAEIAEREAEERMRKKAIEAFECILYMSTKQLAEECGVSIDRVCEDAGIDYCRQLFIKKLNENENDD